MTLPQIIKLRTNDGLEYGVDFLVGDVIFVTATEDFQICHRLQAARLLTTVRQRKRTRLFVRRI